MDKCIALERKKRKYLVNILLLVSANISTVNAIPDLMPEENNTCTFGVKKTMRKSGKI
tara:strand:- start:27 stop:200 length:174 start_codon:yes stop_codon:yes gene_type:complete